MKKTRIAVIFLVIVLALMIPIGVFASYDVYYCSWNASPGGDGSWKYPWLCSNSAEFDDIVDVICYDNGGDAILYEKVPSGYYRHVILWGGASDCGVESSVFYYGYPPHTGLTLPPPLMISGALVIGLSLFAVGLVVYRRRLAN
ncbi:MAG: hypothetical protein ACK2U3_13745 [Anaerolineales bacterium]|jgi:hypothetical protein